MRIKCRYQNQERTEDFAQLEVIVGRPDGASVPNLDLSPDPTVSRRHARLWAEQGVWWVEDLNSRFGTLVNGEKLLTRRVLKPGDSIRIGETTLAIVDSADDSGSGRAQVVEATAGLPNVEIGPSLDARETAGLPAKLPDLDASKRLSLLFELPLQLGAELRVDGLLQIIIERVVDVIRGAKRGALLLRERHSERLLLKAYVSVTEPAVSHTLANRAMAEHRAFIWQRTKDAALGGSIEQHHIETGMYAPLVWKEQVLGVICVDNPTHNAVFSEDDLRLLLAVAQYAAMAVANHQLQEELRFNNKVLERLLTNFSPRIRETLLEKARQGRLFPGGEKSEVTILFSDMRGFTQTSATMETEAILEMLSDYSTALIGTIFKCNGTVERIIGDAILAVFGSPEADPDQHENALRAAQLMQAEVKKLQAHRHAAGKVACEIGIGIHCGEVLHGFIGASDRMEFRVVGDAVNRASRYCDGAQAGEILISPELFQRVFKLVRAEKTQIATKHEGDLTAYRVKAVAA